MYPDQYWSWHAFWVFPMFMPLFWIIVIGLCLYFIFGRNRNRRTWVPGRGFEDDSALDILKNTLRQRGDQQRRIRADEAGY